MKHLIALILLAAALLPQAFAESFAPTTEAITPHSACGALAVGMREDGTRIKGQAAERDGAQRVNGAGYWEFCAMPPLCKETVILVWRDPRTRKTCNASVPTWPARYTPGPEPYTTRFAADANGSGDPSKGVVRAICTPQGKWQVVEAHCTR